MYNTLFCSLVALFLANFLWWCFTHLPGERWQMFAVVPVKKNEGKKWQGANLTYYGLFVATSQLISITLLLVLLGSMGISNLAAMVAVLLVLAVSIPAARLVAMVVEKKRHTFTIGGASFVGILAAPFAILLTNELLSGDRWFLPVLPVLSAMSIAYTMGEGLGRLGCISYGCCYGKPLKDCSGFQQWLFKRSGFIFYGETKKVSYEANLDGERLVPIQAITCILYCSGAIFGSYLFLAGLFTPALIFTIGLTQLWRIVSETMRADFRGFGKISVYQKMGLLSVLYILAAAYFLPAVVAETPAVLDGILALWNPAVILVLQLLWLVFFYVFGRSTVTSSEVSFELIRERI